MATVGYTTLDFGSVPGTNVAIATVTGQAAFSASGSYADAWIDGSDSTAQHNAEEHAIVPLVVRVVQRVNGVGFTIEASSDWRLTGTFKVRWVWL